MPENTDGEGVENDAAPAPPAHLAGLSGMDLVRRTLEEARGAGLARRSRRPGPGRPVSPCRGRPHRAGAVSGWGRAA